VSQVLIGASSWPCGRSPRDLFERPTSCTSTSLGPARTCCAVCWGCSSTRSWALRPTAVRCGVRHPQPQRVNVRNGHRHRDFDTRVGTIDVAAPSCAPELAEDEGEGQGHQGKGPAEEWSTRGTCSGTWSPASATTTGSACPSRASRLETAAPM